MPKKLTALGVLAAVVFGAFSVFGTNTTSAGPGGAAQNFAVDADICYGSAPGSSAPNPPETGPNCPGSSNASVAAGSTATTWSTAIIRYGSRLTLPVSFVPGDSSGNHLSNTDGFGIAPVGAGNLTGEVTAMVDIGCDGTYQDILAEPAPVGVVADWPAGWNGVDLEEQTLPRPSWVRHPYDWPIVYNSEATLTSLHSGGIIVPIVPDPIPLNVVIGTSPYKTGLRASVAQLGGDPSAPGGFLCQDSPQSSSTSNLVGEAPTTPGLYATWTVYTSAIDFRTWTVSRVIDVQCVQVGGPASTGPCTTDSDGDDLVDQVELHFGTNPAAPDSDGDGADDLDEMIEGTRATTASVGFVADCAPIGATNSPYSNAVDTDCDGQRDPKDNGADQTPGSKATIEDTDIDDNCPADFNPQQENTDSPRFAPNPQPVNNDASDPMQDLNGDVCDTDDDDDDMDDVVEGQLSVRDNGLGATCNADLPPATGFTTAANNATGSLDSDRDDDGGLDGRECRHLRNPENANAANRMVASHSAAEGGSPADQERFYRNYNVNLAPAPGETDDLDGDGLIDDGDADSDTCPVAGPCNGAVNFKNDRLLDALEVKFHGTRSSSDDSDGDGCGDGKEASDVTGNRNTDVIDLSQVAAVSGSIRNVAGELDQTKVNRDINRSGAIDVLDLQQVAANIDATGSPFNCLAQGGVTVAKDRNPFPTGSTVMP